MDKYVRELGIGIPDPQRHNSEHTDHVAHAKPGMKVYPDQLHVICVISNPVRFKVRYELYRAFEKHMDESGVVLYTVEMAFGGRPFEVTESDNPRHVQLRSSFELWSKEDMINIGISRLPPEAKFIAWIDADVTIVRPDWAQETLQQLQHYQIVQIFSHAQDVGPNYEPIQDGNFDSFMYSYLRGLELPYKQETKGLMYPYGTKWAKVGDMQQWHCGYAWAARREAIDHLGGLIDWAILGSGDHNMCAALIGKVDYTIHGKAHPRFIEKMMIWQERAIKHIRMNVGYVDGLLLHHWHGSKANRGYVDRWKIIVDNQFDPNLDLKRDSQGLYQLVDNGDMRSIKLRDDIRRYFRQRNEDSIDV